MDGGKERRRDARVEAGFPLLAGEKGASGLDYVENISCGGALCRATGDVAMMTKVSLVFDLPGREPQRMVCDAVVVRREEQGTNLKVGVVFTNISAANREAISRFVSSGQA